MSSQRSNFKIAVRDKIKTRLSAAMPAVSSDEATEEPTDEAAAKVVSLHDWQQSILRGVQDEVCKVMGPKLVPSWEYLSGVAGFLNWCHREFGELLEEKHRRQVPNDRKRQNENEDEDATPKKKKSKLS